MPATLYVTRVHWTLRAERRNIDHMYTVQEIFERYEAIRGRLPKAKFPQQTRTIGSLMDIADQVDAFVFDAFGVLNVGETPIPGAAARIDALRARGCAIRVLSNAASYNHEGAVEKFRRLGMSIAREEIITSRDATRVSLDERLWGCIATPADDLSDIPGRSVHLGDDPVQYEQVEGFLFLSAAGWSHARQALLCHALKTSPRPLIIANADIAAPRETGFSLEPGCFGHLLLDEIGGDIRFFGKPFADAYTLAEASLGDRAPNRIAMVGDTLHTDIIGGASRGWQTVLVTQDGMFAGHDVRDYCDKSMIKPDWCTERI